MARNGKLYGFPSRDMMARSLADIIAEELSLALQEAGAARLAVSGGSTPEELYRVLSDKPLDWSRISATLVDERWAPPGHKLSNESFVLRTLARNAARDIEIVGLWSDAPTLDAAAAAASETLNCETAPFDVVVLGLGADGHTASWFPHSDGLDEALSAERKICAVTARESAVAGGCVNRLTMSLGAVANARLISMMIAGDEKRAAFDKAREDGPVEEMPVRAILQVRPDLCVFWAP